MHSLLITIMFYLQNYNDLEWIFNKEMLSVWIILPTKNNFVLRHSVWKLLVLSLSITRLF